MKENRSFQETIARIGQKLRSSRKRYIGVLLILLGIVLGIVSRAAGGSPFQDFTTGILMGLSTGILLVGILAVLLSFIRRQLYLDRAPGLPVSCLLPSFLLYLPYKGDGFL